MLYEDVKVICNVMCVALLNKILFVDLGVGKMFYSSTMLQFDDDGIRLYSVYFLVNSSEIVTRLILGLCSL